VSGSLRSSIFTFVDAVVWLLRLKSIVAWRVHEK